MKIQKMHDYATIPTRGSMNSAGIDLYAAEDVILYGCIGKLVPTGLKMAIPEGHVGLIWPRSGLAVGHWIDTLAGVIDSDYRGEVKVMLFNHANEVYIIKQGDRIAQMIIQKYEHAVFDVVTELSESQRGENGFGSTGK